MNKVMVFGIGAMGSAAAVRLGKEPSVKEIICAVHDQDELDDIARKIEKAKCILLESRDLYAIVKAAEGVDLLRNALPLEYTKNVLDAALTVKANYQDYASAIDLNTLWEESNLFDPDNEPEFDNLVNLEWWRSIKALYEIYGSKFKEIGRLALFETGSAQGLICAATRYAMRYLDEYDIIYNFI